MKKVKKVKVAEVTKEVKNKKKELLEDNEKVLNENSGVPKIADKFSNNSKIQEKINFLNFFKKIHVSEEQVSPLAKAEKFTTHRKYSNESKFKKSESSGGDQEGSDRGMD